MTSLRARRAWQSNSKRLLAGSPHRVIFERLRKTSSQVSRNDLSTMKELVKDKIITAVKMAGVDDLVDFNVDCPPDAKMGDWSTNVAMILASEKKQNPREIAEKIISRLGDDKEIKKAEIAGPGFINITLDEKIYYEKLKEVLEQADHFGKIEQGHGKKISIDYVSANPTGPVHIGNARGGPVGEALARIFEWSGNTVSRDYYLNDTGVQTKRLGESIYYYLEKNLGKEAELPEDGYQGAYIEEVYKDIIEKYKSELDEIKEREDIVEFLRVKGLEILVEGMKEDLSLINIEYDNWYSQTEIQKSGETKKVIEDLTKAGSTVSREGALWFVNPSDPEFEDRESVLVKSDDKTLTYFADDIAFHMMRYREGTDKIFDLFGPNHDGHVARMKSSTKVLGIKDERLEILLYQWVRIKNGDELVSMSKRQGNFVTLRQVLESGVEADAFKYLILAQNLNTPLDFDLKLAKDRSDKNPVYYIKYAHARICSIIRRAKSDGVEESGKADLTKLSDTKELALIRELVKLPNIVSEINDSFQIQALPHYAYKIAKLFHDFYSSCQVLSDDKELTASRLLLVHSAKIVLKNVLEIMAIDAPEKM